MIKDNLKIKQEFRKHVEQLIQKRVVVQDMYDLFGIGQFIIAGNSLNSTELHDIDVFLANIGYDDYKSAMKRDYAERVMHIQKSGWFTDIVQDTNTIKFKSVASGQQYHLCSYTGRSLSSLVQSFDFSHVQIGALCRVVNVEKREYHINHKIDVLGLYCTDAYLITKFTGEVAYTGSEYPLGSLERLNKYVKYGDISEASARKMAPQIIGDIISRGYRDYKDFENQLDAAGIDGGEELWQRAFKKLSWE